MRKILLCIPVLALGLAGVAFAQTGSDTDTQMSTALEALSVVYGAPVVRADQAKAICNEEKYVVECAEIGKKYKLYSSDRAKQVDTLLTEFKGEVVQKMKQCEDAACLVDVATSIASRLSSNNATIAKAVELTPQKVREKRDIVQTAKELGVDMEACRTMDPDTAPVDLLRNCAKLAKHENVKKYVPQAVKERFGEVDAAISLKESLSNGAFSCGDGTLEGCGKFCLSPSPEARAQGTSAIPNVCRDIATKFFGDKGIKELESAYSNVQKTFTTLADRAQNISFKTTGGRTLFDPEAIGKYMEEAGSRGDVETVSRGMDFLVAKGFVTPDDREFALKMVRKVNEKGPVDFNVCRTDPARCADLIPEDERAQFSAMSEIEKVMRSEMANRGIADPSVCSSDPSKGQSCLEAARAALPKVERFASSNREAQMIVSDIRQKIRFGEAGLDARARVEERFKSAGDFSIGDQRFNSLSQVESFCKTSPQQCLTESARKGIFARDVAEERYAQVIETNYKHAPPEYVPQRPGVPVGGKEFNKEEALAQFKQWLDNPQGPPPMPSPRDVGMYSQYTPYPLPQPGTYPPFLRQTDPRTCVYPQVVESPCASGEYRQESIDEFGCRRVGSCIPINTRTEPPRKDGLTICPALPTVDSCPSGEEKVISYSSPECGTYYACKPMTEKPTPVPYPTPIVNCEKYGIGWRAVDSSGNCFNTSFTEYRTPAGTSMSCATSPVYGCASITPPNPVPIPTGQKEQVWNSKGLRSWIRTDADQARIESLKSACANVSSSANVWMPNAGTQSSPDFGMPDPAKCARAAGCSSAQYFNGDSCTESTVTNQRTCGSGEYWNGTSCVPSGSVSGMRRCTYPNASRNGSSLGTVWCEADYFNCREGGSSGAVITLAGLSLGAPSNCESGWTNIQSCPSGQYWSGTACVPATTQQTTGSCSSELIALLGSGCHSMSNGWFNEPMTQYVLSGSQTVRSCVTDYVSGCSGAQTPSPTSCPSGQYWSGTACVTSYTQSGGCRSYSSQSTCQPAGCTWYENHYDGTHCDDAAHGQSTGTTGTNYTSTSCGANQYWDSRTNSCKSNESACAEAGGTWDSSANYCRMPSTSTQTGTTGTTGTYTTDYSRMQTDCASAGGTWDSSANYCQMPSSTSGTYTAPSSGSTGSTDSSSGTYTAPSPESSGTYTAPTPAPEPAPAPAPEATPAPTVSYLFCPDGHEWNGAFCVLAPRSPLGQYLANVLSGFRAFFRF